MDVLNYPGPVEAILPAGEENAVSSSDCMAVLGVDDMRHFRELVEAERAQGAVILANGKGLFLPDEGAKGRAELIKFVRLGEARIKGQARAIKPARQALKRMEGQIPIVEDSGERGEA